MPKYFLFIIKAVLSIFVGAALALPILMPEYGSGFMREMQILGLTGSLIVIAVFLALVSFYCRDLQRVLDKIQPQNRNAKPNSVWLMFLLPYNFIEDFFIMYNIAVSIKREAAQNSSLQFSKRYGLFSGIGWCSAQIISLLPGVIGQTAGLVALILWVAHWVFVRKALRLLRSQ